MSTGICQACSLNCDKCETNNICLTCKSGFVLLMSANQTTCVTTCLTGTYLDSATNMCVGCSSNCSSCTSNANCLQCSSSMILHLGYCISTCPSGFTNINQTCLPCLTGCKVCGPLYTCTQCTTGYTLSSSNCTVTVNNCSNGYYLNILSACSQCFPTCNTCSGGLSTNCLSCFSGYTLSSGVCLQVCAPNSYLDTNTSVCK